MWKNRLSGRWVGGGKRGAHRAGHLKRLISGRYGWSLPCFSDISEWTFFFCVSLPGPSWFGFDWGVLVCVSA